MNRLFEQILAQRGLDEGFLRPKYHECAVENMPEGSPEAAGGVFDAEKGEKALTLSDARKAAERLLEAVSRGERIMIYGDYDADGVTASTVMYDALTWAGAKEVVVMLPDRFVDGYGMGSRCVERAMEEGVKLVVTVDCGSNNPEVIEELAARGIETVVTDHHEVSGELPEAVAVVNPKRPDVKCPEGLQYLAGVGVAFMVARELVKLGAIPVGQEKWMLDLVLIGTICDSMVLLGANRELCYWGMQVLAKTRRPGLKELMRKAGVKAVTADAIGFQLGPRINAAGRMASAEVALRLLMTQSRAEAIGLADELEQLNNKRKTQQNAAVREVEATGVGEEPVIVACGKWHEGILGIIAGRLTEQYKRPAFALSEVEEGVLKGSGRSFGEFSLAEALGECREQILGGGGHAGACGVKVATAKLEGFRKAINDYYRGLGLVDQERFLACKEDLTVERLADLDLELLEDLQRLEPFGPGNQEPVFLLSKMQVREVRLMGVEGQHLKLAVVDREGMELRMVAFGAPEEWKEAEVGDEVDVWMVPMLNEWNGRRTVEGRMLEVKIRAKGVAF